MPQEESAESPDLLRAKIAQIDAERAKSEAERRKLDREGRPHFWIFSVAVPALVSVGSLGTAAWREDMTTKQEIALERLKLEHEQKEGELVRSKGDVEDERDVLETDQSRLKGEVDHMKQELASKMKDLAALQAQCTGATAKKAITSLRGEAVTARFLIESPPPTPTKRCLFASYQDGGTTTTRAELQREDAPGLARFDKVCALTGGDKTISGFDIHCECS
jgi:hypothetical protein